MDMITKAVQDVGFQIPAEILRLAYSDDYAFNREQPISIDEQITRKTVNARVLQDCNIVGGQTVTVILEDLTPEIYNENILVYKIPPDRVNFRTIMSVLSANYVSFGLVPNAPLPGYIAGRNAGRSDIATAGMQLMDSRSSIPIIQSADCEVIGHNMVMVKVNMVYRGLRDMRCVVENDERLSNLPIRAALDFSKLVVLACKSYIYNRLLVKLDRGYIENGQELPSIKSYVDGLSDAEENYQTFLREKWQGVGAMSDIVINRDLLKLQVSIGL